MNEIENRVLERCGKQRDFTQRVLANLNRGWKMFDPDGTDATAEFKAEIEARLAK